MREQGGITMQQVSRRKFARNAALLAVAGAATGFATSLTAWSRTGNGSQTIKALFFDVFGSLVDWRTGVARESRTTLQPLGYDLDWVAFADAWRAEYQPAMEEVRSGARSFDRLDVLHRRMLERVRGRFGLESLDAATLEALTLAWHRLDAWDDVKRAFPRLRQRF